MRIRERLILEAILVVALLLRLYAAFVQPSPDAILLRGDAREYDEIGWNVATGHGFAVSRDGQFVPIARRAGPLYPFFLAAVYKIAGHQPNAVRLIQSVLGTVLCLILYALGQLLFDRRIGLLAAGLCAIYPLLIQHSYFGGPAFLLTESLFIPLVVLSVLAIVRVTRHPTVLNQVVAGVCLGLSALTRATMLAFPAALLMWLLLLRRWSWASVVRISGTVIVVMLLVIAPWTWRNYNVFGHFVPISTMGGISFWYGNNPLARGGDFSTPLPLEFVKDSPKDEVTINRLGYRAGWQALRANLRRVPFLLVKKILVFWLIVTDTKTWQINWAFILAGFWALIGWWLVRREPIQWLPIIVPSGYLTVIATVFFGDPRFRAPVEPLLLVLAAAGLLGTLHRFKMAMAGLVTAHD